MIGLTAVRSLLIRPAVFVPMGLIAVIAILWPYGVIQSNAKKVCQAQWSTAETEAAQIIADNERTELAAEAARLRQHVKLMADQRDAAIAQKEREKAAKWAARSLLDEIRKTPADADWLDAVWPDGPAEWLCQPTGSGPGCGDKDPGRIAGRAAEPVGDVEPVSGAAPADE